jgi:hypothetical protein
MPSRCNCDAVRWADKSRGKVHFASLFPINTLPCCIDECKTPASVVRTRKLPAGDFPVCDDCFSRGMREGREMLKEEASNVTLQ